MSIRKSNMSVREIACAMSLRCQRPPSWPNEPELGQRSAMSGPPLDAGDGHARTCRVRLLPTSVWTHARVAKSMMKISHALEKRTGTCGGPCRPHSPVTTTQPHQWAARAGPVRAGSRGRGHAVWRTSPLIICAARGARPQTHHKAQRECSFFSAPSVSALSSERPHGSSFFKAR